MKIGKRAGMITSFIVGASIFASTAIADMVSQNGYDELKSAAKFTAVRLEGKLNNFTIETSGMLKSDGKVIESGDTIDKYDNVNFSKEETSKVQSEASNYDNYYYSDKKCMISKRNEDDTYQLNEYSGDRVYKNYMFHNPFKEDNEKDLERILDALVGNLKDYAVSSEQSDGSKEISGNLTETQIPTIINALISYEYKNEVGRDISNESNKQKTSPLTDDVYLKEAKLKASISKDGLLDNVFVTGTISGKDKEGNQHNVTAEVLYKLYDINSTNVTKPNLEGKKVNKSTVDENGNDEKPVLTKKCIGKYINDIVIDKDDKLTKVGERVLQITSIEGNVLKGKYHEDYKKEYADTYKDRNDINFEVNFGSANSNSADFTYTDGTGKNKRGNIYIDRTGVSIDFYTDNINIGNILNNTNFERDFD